MPLAYAAIAEFREMAFQGTTTAVSDSLVLKLLKRASRVFDIYVGVAEGYFDRAVFSAWAASTAYAVGDLVRPTTTNAHVYIVTVAGTSAASEPTWPTTSEGTVVNGTVTFQEAGAEGVSSKVIYGDGTNYLKLPPYVAGTLVTPTMPTGYTVPTYVESGGYLIRKDSVGVLYPYENFTGWENLVPITISARWGFATTPEDVKQAILETALAIWRRKDEAFAKLVGLPDGSVSVSEALSPRAKLIADRRMMKRPVFV